MLRVMFHLKLHEYGINIAQIFWGLWLLPFGYLVLRSFFPNSGCPANDWMLRASERTVVTAVGISELRRNSYLVYLNRGNSSWPFLWLVVKGVDVQMLAKPCP